MENAPRILSTDELIDRGWGVDYVSVAAIRQAISELRQALGSSATERKTASPPSSSKPASLGTTSCWAFARLSCASILSSRSPESMAIGCPEQAGRLRSQRG